MTGNLPPALAEEDALRLDRQVCFPLYAATNLLQRLYRPLLAPLGLTYSQYLVMLLLWERERQPFSVGEIQACLHLDIGTLSPLLKRMEKAALIVRHRDRVDARRVLVGLTSHGRELREPALGVPNALAIQTGLKESEVEELRTQTQTLVRKLSSLAG